jgi:hypothetical protein
MAEEKKTVAYSKEQVVGSKKYRAYCDIYAMLLESDKLYTAEELQKIRDGFLKREVIEEIN